MRTLFRDLARQRLRTLLTTSGVALGIFTLVVLGALGEHFRATVNDAKAYAHGLVRLYTKTNSQGVNPGITPEDLATVRALPGVERVCPTIMLYFDGFDLEDDPLSFMTPRPLVEGLPAASAERLRGLGIRLSRGRWLAEGDDRQAMLVEWLARRRGLDIGDTVTIRRLKYEVVGLYEAPDTPVVAAGMVPYARLNKELIQPQIDNAQRFLGGLKSGSSGSLLAGLVEGAQGEVLESVARDLAVAQANLFRIYEIVPKDRSHDGTLALAAKLREVVPHLAVIDPDRIEEQMERAVAIFLVITLIVTVLSTVVGGLLIVNTMAMAVIERRKEIAIKAALGATPGQLSLEFVAEAAALALVGALLGVGLGTLTIALTEPYLLEMIETGSHLFLITPRLVGISLLYALVMGVLAGGIPAIRASRIEPAITLREL
jgi:ABC-type antimicrobial peptide transport system permease subunit